MTSDRIESAEIVVDKLVLRHVKVGDAIPAAIVADAIRRRDRQWETVIAGMADGATDCEIGWMLDTIGPLEVWTEEKRARMLRKIGASA